MKTDYCAWPPQIASGVECAAQQDGDRPALIISSASVGRYLLLRTAEYRALRLLDEKLTPAAVRNEFMRQHVGTLRLATLTKFPTRLDKRSTSQSPARFRRKSNSIARLLPGNRDE